jgi:hypothetical protein
VDIAHLADAYGVAADRDMPWHIQQSLSEAGRKRLSAALLRDEWGMKDVVGRETRTSVSFINASAHGPAVEVALSYAAATPMP